jgi:hypothetical protein
MRQLNNYGRIDINTGLEGLVMNHFMWSRIAGMFHVNAKDINLVQPTQQLLKEWRNLFCICNMIHCISATNRLELLTSVFLEDLPGVMLRARKQRVQLLIVYPMLSLYVLRASLNKDYLCGTLGSFNNLLNKREDMFISYLSHLEGFERGIFWICRLFNYYLFHKSRVPSG